MKFLHSLALSSALVVCSAGALHAQDSQVTPAQAAQAEKAYRQQWFDNTVKGCNATAAVKNVNAKSQACQCYANAFLARYTFGELVATEQMLKKVPQASGLIPVLLSPEAAKCKVITR